MKCNKKPKKSSTSMTTSASTSTSSSGEEDDGYPWFGCVCGRAHETFWIQCEACNAWFNVSPQCLGYDEAEADKRRSFQCHSCSSAKEKEALHDSSDYGVVDKEKINREDTAILTHTIYSSDLEYLDNTKLCSPQYVLTERSVAVCSRLITYFLLKNNENKKSNFRKDLWEYLWYCLRFEQKINGWELGWNSYMIDGHGKCKTKHYFVPKKSPQSNGKEGTHYFTSPEGTVAFICDVIQNVDRNAFDSLENDDIELFQSNLLHAVDNNTTYHSMLRKQVTSRSQGTKRLRDQQVSNMNVKKQPQSLIDNVYEKEIVDLTIELLNAIAASNYDRIAALSAKDSITYKKQQLCFEEENTGLTHGPPGTEVVSDKSCGNKIFLSDHRVEFQGEFHEVAVISYTRHDVNSSFDETTRNEVRIWTKKNSTWINTFTCTLPLLSVRL